MIKIIRRISILLFLIPVTLVIWLMMTESGLHWVYDQVRHYQSDTLHINNLQGRLIGPVTFSDIEYQQNGRQLVASQIQLDWKLSSLLTANIHIQQLTIQSLDIVLAKKEKINNTELSGLELPEINLPWRLILNNIQINNINITEDNTHFNLKQVTLNASTLFKKIDIEKFNIITDTVKFNIKGSVYPTRLYRHDLRISWQAELPSKNIIEGTGHVSGNLKATRIKQQLTKPLQLTLDAKLNDSLSQASWEAKVDVKKFDASLLDSRLPAVKGSIKLDVKGDINNTNISGRLLGEHHETGPVEADFILKWLNNNIIQIDQLKLTAATSNTLINAHGQWSPAADGGDMAMKLSWENLRWPITTSPWFNSAQGQASINGNFNQYQFTLDTDSPWPQAAPSKWFARADGNLKGLTFHRLQVNALNGEAVATGQVNWSPSLNWQANIKATNIDPAGRWPQWRGLLNASLINTGQIVDDKLMISTDITKLYGHMRDHPVSLQSQFSWRDNVLDIKQLKLQAGQSRVSLQGQLGNNMNMNWDIDSSNLAELYPRAEGTLVTQGSLIGAADAPVVKASLNGSKLKLMEQKLGSVDGTLTIDLFKWQQTDIKLAAKALKLNNFQLQSLTLNASRHDIKLNAVSDIATAFIELKGTSQDNSWQGQVERADIESKRFDNWTLKKPVAVSISSKNFSTNTLCWKNDKQASICTNLQKENDHWQSQIEFDQAPLELLSPWLPAELKLHGIMNASTAFQLKAADLIHGNTTIELPPGALSYALADGETQQWAYSHGKLTAVLDHQGLNLKSDLAMKNGDLFKLNASLPGIHLFDFDQTSQTIDADLQLNIQDLALIEALVPEVQHLKGDIDINLSATGTVAQPRIKGKASLQNAALQIPRLGLSIDRVTAQAHSDGFEKLSIQLDAHSGEGYLNIKSLTRMDKSIGWPSEISIKGNKFEVSRIPEARLQVSPDLTIKTQQRNINVSGEVHIPYAKLQPKDVSTAAHVSEDAVVLGSEQTKDPKWHISSRVRMILGERVHFYGFGFEGRLGGKLLLNDEPGQLTRATGEISIPEGRYRAYGQRLDVEHGRLLYTGGPLSNPGLDFRAVRKINAVTAGVKVKGSLDQPVLELFTLPAMGQTDALSYLLLGRPIENTTHEEGSMMARAALALGLSGGDRLARILGDQFGLDEMRVESNEQGDQASLVIGRYLSPRLYISYGVGLVEAFNTVTVRYQLADQWQIKAESGEHQGADIQYTIEK